MFDDKLKVNLFSIMKFISTKGLRNTLPNIRRQLARGQEYLLIHQSKPIAKISPVQDSDNEPMQAILEDFQQASMTDMDDDFLTKDEVDYYLSLP
jgi:antitoxin (DNA-binding transcriptional repressor) of toxin-antitoxin stability system